MILIFSISMFINDFLKLNSYFSEQKEFEQFFEQFFNNNNSVIEGINLIIRK